MRLDFFVKLKYQSNTKLLSVIIKYSVCDPIFDVTKLADVRESADIIYLM